MLLDVVADAVPAFHGACQIDRYGNRLRAFDALWMVVCHHCELICQLKRFVQSGSDVSTWDTRIAESLPKMP